MPSQNSSFSQLFDSDPEFLEALANIPLTIESVLPHLGASKSASNTVTVANQQPQNDLIKRPTPSNVLGKRSRSSSPELQYIHDLSADQAMSQTPSGLLGSRNKDSKEQPFDVYGPSKFGGFGEYMVRKRAKLQNQNTAIHEGDTSKPALFKGVQVYINGFTRPPLQELRVMLLEHGGIFHAYLDRKSMVTHVIAEQLTPSKWKEYVNLKIVTPSWIVDSIKAQKLLPWRSYRLRQSETIRPDVRAVTAVQGTQLNLASTFMPRTPESSRPSSHQVPPPAKELPVPVLPNLDSAPVRTKPPDPEPANVGTVAQKPLESTSEDEPKQRPSYAAHPSNQHANRLMQDPKWRADNTSAGGAPFVEGFFKRSRLHYLSTWKSELKILVKSARSGERTQTRSNVAHSMRGSELVISHTSPLKEKPGRPSVPTFDPNAKERSTGSKRVIMHCDFDSFFVSAGLTSRPELKGQPVVVCHAQGDENASVSTSDFVAQSTSEVASASYEARAKGVKNGMSLGQAKKLCPEVQTIPYEFERYKDFSIKFYNVLLNYADDLEVTSVDEAMIDVTARVVKEAELRVDQDEPDPAKHLAERIRADVRKATSCEVSIGIGESPLLARIATKTAKPARSYHLKTEDAIEHLAPLPLSVLPGFGWSTIEKIKNKWNVSTCGEAQLLKDESALQKVLGPGTGSKLYHFVRGQDNRGLKSDEMRKTVSANINYAIRFENLEQVRTFLFALGKEVAARLQADSLLGRSLTLLIMRRAEDAPIEAPKFLGHGSCDTFNYSTAIYGSNGSGTADPTLISMAAWRLVQTHHSKDVVDLRGVGISITSLQDADAIASDRQSKLSFVPKPVPSRSSSEDAREKHGRVREASIDLTGLDDSAPSTPTKSNRTFDFAGAKRITRQMASRSGTASPTKYNIFTKRERPTTTISDNELRDLDIDPEVFRALPSDIQKEQLNAQRIVMRNLRGSVGPGMRDSRSRSRSRSTSVVPQNNLMGIAFPDPTGNLTIAQFTNIPALKKAKTAEELQDIVAKWFHSGLDDGPEPGAVDSMRDFLLRCLSQQGDLALDKVTSTLKWWHHLCRSRWGSDQTMTVLHGENPKDPGSLWWSAFRTVKDAVDSITQERFGASISLR